MTAPKKPVPAKKAAPRKAAAAAVVAPVEPSKAPVAKVQAAGFGGALSVIAIWVAAQFGVDMPAEVGAGIATLAAFAAGYLKKS